MLVHRNREDYEAIYWEIEELYHEVEEARNENQAKDLRIRELEKQIDVLQYRR